MSDLKLIHSAGVIPTRQPLPATPGAQVESLLAQVDAMQSELDRLRELADARRYHMEQVERELKLAARLQRDFLPKKLPNHGKVKFNRLYRPAGHVSGDLYDVRRLDETYVGVYLADAIGHGMPAALLAMFMHNALQTKKIEKEGYRLLRSEEAMGHLNAVLCGQDLAHTTFATAIYARVDLENGSVDFSRAGHPLPMLIRKDGVVEEIGGEGALLGVMPEEQFEPASLTLEPGDKLIFYTDGLEVAFVEPGTPGDIDQWRDAVHCRRHLGADALLADLGKHLEERGPVDDDITVVTLEMT